MPAVQWVNMAYLFLFAYSKVFKAHTSFYEALYTK